MWLNKAKEAGEVRNNISIVEPSSGTDTKIILIKNMSPEKIWKIEVIIKNLMNLDTSDSESDKDNLN